jgi:hypothetical protein
MRYLIHQFSVNTKDDITVYCVLGCGSGKYLHVNPDVFKVGADRCARLTELAREKEHEVRKNIIKFL